LPLSLSGKLKLVTKVFARIASYAKFKFQIRRERVMKGKKANVRLMSSITALGLPILVTTTAFADTAGVSNVDNFIKSVITVLAGLAGLIATGFFVVGGFSYITSSGNPEHLDRAKRTITYSAIGLSVTIAAFVISTIVTTLATNAFGG
jgi:TRAP-type C4-dicarboxylate transport system permease small subunit